MTAINIDFFDKRNLTETSQPRSFFVVSQSKIAAEDRETKNEPRQEHSRETKGILLTGVYP